MSKTMRELKIKPVLNGFIVEVGCQTLVYTSITRLADDLIKYQRDPEQVEKEFVEEAVNQTLATQLVGTGFATGGLVASSLSTVAR